MFISIKQKKKTMSSYCDRGFLGGDCTCINSVTCSLQPVYAISQGVVPAGTVANPPIVASQPAAPVAQPAAPVAQPAAPVAQPVAPAAMPAAQGAGGPAVAAAPVSSQQVTTKAEVNAHDNPAFQKD